MKLMLLVPVSLQATACGSDSGSRGWQWMALAAEDGSGWQWQQRMAVAAEDVLWVL